jgi:hypothetical protein
VLWSLLHYLWYLTLIKDRCIIRGINPCTSTEQPRIFVDQNYKSLFLAWHQWLIPVILATQEDHSSKPAWANSSQNPILKKHNTKKGWQSSSGCRRWAQAPVLPKKSLFLAHIKPKGIHLFSDWWLCHLLGSSSASSESNWRNVERSRREEEPDWCQSRPGPGLKFIILFIFVWTVQQPCFPVILAGKSSKALCQGRKDMNSVKQLK